MLESQSRREIWLPLLELKEFRAIEVYSTFKLAQFYLKTSNQLIQFFIVQLVRSLNAYSPLI